MNAQAPDVLRDVLMERIRQHAKWGEQNHADGTGADVRILALTDINLDLRTGSQLANVFTKKCQRNGPGEDTWRDILLEEVFEAMAESDWPALRKELIQSAAVIVAWVEAGDRRQ